MRLAEVIQFGHLTTSHTRIDRWQLPRPDEISDAQTGPLIVPPLIFGFVHVCQQPFFVLQLMAARSEYPKHINLFFGALSLSMIAATLQSV